MHGPSPGLSQPDEGSIAEKDLVSFDEKLGEESYFHPEVVDKELADLRVAERGVGTDPEDKELADFAMSGQESVGRDMTVE